MDRWQIFMAPADEGTPAGEGTAAAAPPAAPDKPKDVGLAASLPPVDEGKDAPAAQPDALPQPARVEGPKYESRPDWLPEQFWDAKTGEAKLEAMGKSWLDFRGKVSKGFDKVPKAPEGYKFDVPEAIKERFKDAPELWDPASVDADPLLKGFLAKAHELELPHHVVAGLVPWYLEAYQKYMDENVPATDPAAEIKKLGHGGEALIRQNNTLVQEMRARGFVGDEEMIELELTLQTAAGQRAVSKLIEYLGGPSMPVQTQQAVSQTTSADDASRKLAELMAKPSPTEREVDDVRKLFDQVYGTAPAGVTGRPAPYPPAA